MSERGGRSTLTKVGRLLAPFLAIVVLTPSASVAQEQRLASDDAPQVFEVVTRGAPVRVEASAPTVLPLKVETGLAVSSVSASSQPLMIAEAAPVWVPLLSATGLLGGVSPALLIRLLPGLVLGLPAIFGLPAVPVDPGELSPVIEPLAGLPYPDGSPYIPVVGCQAHFPGDPREATCGGPSQDLLGFEGDGAVGRARTAGSPDDAASWEASAATSMAALRPEEGNTVGGILSFGGIASSASSSVIDGRIVGASTTRLTDLRVGPGGLVHIESLASHVSGALDGTSTGGSLERVVCDLGKVTVGGFPAVIDAEGVRLLDMTELPVPAEVLVENLNGVLAGSGTVADLSGDRVDFGASQIRLAPASPAELADDGSTLRSTSGCIEITHHIPVSGSTFRVTLGQVALQMSALHAFEPFASPRAGAPGPAFAPGEQPPAPLAPGMERLGAGAPPPAPLAPGDGAGAPHRRSFLDERTALELAALSRWDDVYRWFALIPLLAPFLLVTRRLTWIRR